MESTSLSSGNTSEGVGKIDLNVDYSKVVSFARQQAGLPLMHSVYITNGTDEILPGAELVIQPDPVFASVKRVRLADVIPGGVVTLDTSLLDMPFSTGFLSAQRERIRGTLNVELRCGEAVKASAILPIAVLAYNEWSGLEDLPEVLAAFSTPNQPAVARLLGVTAKHLAKTTGKPALDGYQSKDPRRVFRIIEAIFSAVRDADVVYSVPPASFEQSGQKIRFPEEVLGTRLGTCLETALLFAAALEASGLKPILMMDRGHAYAGCWMDPGGFELPVLDDLQQIRKLTDGTDPKVIVFETTIATSGNDGGFSEAETQARKHLHENEDFRFAIDIARARDNRILPLPVGIKDGCVVVDVPTLRPSGGSQAVSEASLDTRFHKTVEEKPQETLPKDRLAYWANQLLDLSLRNRLLNFGRNKSIRVFSHAIDILEDKLAENAEFTLLPAFEDDPRDTALHNKRHGEDLDKERLSKELDARKLRVACTKEELDKRLLALAHDAKLSLEESGANTLYLAVGIMEWQDASLPGVRGQKVHSAPILLVPVTLTRQSVRSGYKLRRLDEETRVNVTLLEMLKRDFEIEVKGVNPPPEDESGVNVPLILKRFRNAVLNSKGFYVKDEAHLGIFQFTKFLLWKDLIDRAKELRENPVVAHLIDTPRKPYQPPESGVRSPIEPKTLDATIHPSKNFCIKDADSSQLSAVASATAGLSFVMIGPPGTGKSQTISNIISTLIAMGKTVLFVAEKRAALEVVQHRLEKAGLGPFLLEVHSNKSGKAEIVEQFRKAVEFGSTETPSEWEHYAACLQQLRTELNDTVRALHKRLPNGYSAYRCHGILVGVGSDLPRLIFRAIEGHTPEKLTVMRRVLGDISLHISEIPDSEVQQLSGIRRKEWSPAWESEALEAISQLNEAIRTLENARKEIEDGLNVNLSALTIRQITPLVIHAKAFLNAPAVAESFVMESDRSIIEQCVQSGLDAVASISKSKDLWAGWNADTLLAAYSPNVIEPIRHYDDGRINTLKTELTVLREKLSGLPASILSQGACVAIRDFGHDTELKRVNAARYLRGCGAKTQSSLEEVCALFEIHASQLSLSSIRGFASLLQFTSGMPCVHADFIRSRSSDELQRIIQRAIDATDARRKAYEDLKRWSIPQLLLLNVEELHTSWEHARGSWFLFKPIRKRAFVNLLRKDSQSGELVLPYEEVDTFLTQVENLQACEKAWERSNAHMNKLFIESWNSGNYDKDSLYAAVEWHRQFCCQVEACSQLPGVSCDLCGRIADLMESDANAMRTGGACHALCQRFSTQVEQFGNALNDACTLFGINTEDLEATTPGKLFDFISPELVQSFHEALRILHEAKADFDNVDKRNASLFGKVWNAGQPRAGTLQAAAEWHREMSASAKALSVLSPVLAGELRSRMAKIVGNAPERLNASGDILQCINQLDKAASEFCRAFEYVVGLLEFDKADWASSSTSSLSDYLAGIQSSSMALRKWCRLNELRAQAKEMELSRLLDAVDEGTVQAKELPATFDKAYARACLNKLVNDDPVLQKFFKAEHSRRIDEFRKLDVKLTDLAGQVVQALVASRRPRTTDSRDRMVDFGEVGILHNEMTKKRRHIAIRQLFTEIPTILPKLKPCLLMSPLSVAQYLDASHSRFDAVIFDEASQIPVCDAIGAMARGAQVIITGDPQQLPPTSFFQRGSRNDEESDADYQEVPESAESILDECDAAGLPKINLAWHYRSRHESLIAFSNHHYYGNRLLTNPEAAVQDNGVRFHYVGGVYDRGGSQTNKEEAYAIVSAVSAHYKNSEMNRVSIGVVTFNSQQANLIEALLDDACLKDTELDTLVSAESREPLFVKNLENVQGDERDIIVFSTTFGRDAAGVSHHNFGPINTQGGERRLNVAITRARLGVEVFSSMRAEDIDLNKTGSIGARHLKAYLDFAARGRAALPSIVRSEHTDIFDSEFERKVAEALRSQGWEVHTQIGCSAYRIDMAVVHPEHPGAYAIGIECDGATYHSSATARDRDRLRQSILEDLGWRIHRVWSTEWFHNLEREKAHLFETVHKAIAEYETKPHKTAPLPEPATPAPEPVRIASNFSAPTAPKHSNHKALDARAYKRAVTHKSSIDGMNPYAPDSEDKLREAIREIVCVEGPVPVNELCARVAEMMGMKRATAKLEERLLEMLPRSMRKTVSGGSTYLWPDGLLPDTYQNFRTHADVPNERRALRDICPQEQANAMEHIVHNYHSIPTEDLLRQTVSLFGYGMLSQQMRDDLKPGLRLLGRKMGIAKTDDGYALT